MLFLVNGPKRVARRVRAGVRKLTTRPKRKRKPTAKQIKSRERFARMARAQAKARRVSSKKKTRRTGGSMAAKRKVRRSRKATARKAAPRRKRRVSRRTRTPQVTLRRRGVTVYRSNGRKRRRSYRRNPSFRSGIMGSVISAGKEALGVIGGMAGTNFIARRIPYGDDNLAMTVAKKVAVAVGLGMIVGKVGNRRLAEQVLVGGMVAAASDALRAVPVVGSALAGDGDLQFLSRYGLNAYPTNLAIGGGRMAAWPEAGAGAVVDSGSAYRN